MASSYSIVHDFNNVPLYSPDFAFIGQALQYKQQSLDANRVKVQSMIDGIGNLDVYRDVDKQYIEQRINAAVDIANKYANLDLSDNSLTSSLLANVNQVVDDNVKNAIYSTQVFRSEQQEWQKLKEEKPELYNGTNHAFSMQFSEQWRNGQNPGEVYKGGGGVRPYVDVNKTFMDAIPKIQDMLKAEWVQDSEGNGYFRSLSTYEAVPRDQMEMALNTLLGDREREQLKINAWGTYSIQDPNTIKQEFDSYFNPQLDSARKSLDNYNRLIESETDENKKQQLIQQRDIAERQVNDLSANSFDNIVSQNGLEAAYTSLYFRQFKDNYLNAYSYAPREIKREVNQLDLETRNFEMKVENLNLSKQRLDLATRKQDFYEQQQLLKSGLAGGETSLPLTGSDVPLGEEQGYQSEKMSHNKALQELEENSINQMKSVLGDKFGNLTDTQMLQLAGQLNNITGKDSITLKIDGESVKLDLTNDNNLQAVLDFKNYVLNDNPVKKEKHDSIWKIVGNVSNNLAKVGVGENPNIDFSNMPNFGVKLVANEKDENGNILSFKVVTNNYKGDSYYGHLLQKKNKTKEDWANIKLYTSLHMMNDPALDKQQKKDLFETMQQKIVSRVESEDRDKLPKTWYSAFNASRQQSDLAYKQNILNKLGELAAQSQTEAYQADDLLGLKNYYLQEAEKLGIRKTAEQYYKEIKNPGSTGKLAFELELSLKESSGGIAGARNAPKLGKDWNLSDFDSGDLEWSGGEIGKGFDTYIKNSFKNVYDKAEAKLADLSTDVRLTSQIYSQSNGGATYKKLATTVGLPENTKTPITTTLRLDANGKPTGEVDVRYTGGTQTKPIIYSSRQEDIDAEEINGAEVRPLKALTQSQATSIGMQYTSGDRPTYRASYGENAPAIDLGNGKMSKETEVRIRKIAPSLPLDNAQGYIQQASQFGVQKPVADAIAAYRQGQYKFKMEPVNGQWYVKVLANGKEVYAESTGEVDYTDAEIRELYKTAPAFNQTVFNNYLTDLIQNASIEQSIRDAQNQ